ncbi:MAG: (Fe-S)-binding protein [candidate division WOR-3 bacterium]
MLPSTLNVAGCIQCGRCSGGCPVSVKSALNVRRLVYAALEQTLKTSDLSALGVWECTACTTCNLRCPKNVKPADLVVELRSRLVEGGRMATAVQAALESTFLQGNPWSRAREKRLEWAKDLGVKVLAPGAAADTLLFVCCTNSYDERCRKTAQALVRLLKAAEVDFGILGEEETCCSSEQKRLGEEGLFEELSKSNVELLNSRRVNRVVTLSPHCFNSFKNDYKGVKAPVLHYTQFLAELLESGKLKHGRLDQAVTYHDPCFLGKQNKVYDEPRRLLDAAAGTRFVEYDRNRETSLCCEGGGGRMWAESESKGRLAEVRVSDALEMNARVIATACPFCTLTFEDAVKTTNSEDKVRIADIAEILAEGI